MKKTIIALGGIIASVSLSSCSFLFSRSSSRAASSMASSSSSSSKTVSLSSSKSSVSASSSSSSSLAPVYSAPQITFSSAYMNSWVSFTNPNAETCTLSYSLDDGSTYAEETLASGARKTLSLQTVYNTIFVQAFFLNASRVKSTISTETISPSRVSSFIHASLSNGAPIHPGSSFTFSYSVSLTVWDSDEALKAFASGKISYRYAAVFTSQEPTASDWHEGSLTRMTASTETSLTSEGYWRLTCPALPSGAISEKQNSLVGSLMIEILDNVTSSTKTSDWYSASSFTAYPIAELSSLNFYAGPLSAKTPATGEYHTTNGQIHYHLPSYEDSKAAIFYRDIYAPWNYGACQFWSGYGWDTNTVPELSNEVETTEFWSLEKPNNRYKRTFEWDGGDYSTGYAHELKLAGALKMKGESTSFSPRNFTTMVPASIPQMQPRAMDNSTSGWLIKKTTIALPLYNPGSAPLSLSYEIFVKGTNEAVKKETAVAVPAHSSTKLSYTYDGNMDVAKCFCFAFSFTVDMTGTGYPSTLFSSKRYLMPCKGDSYTIQTLWIQDLSDSYPLY
jgi:hypothetical protein